MVYGLIAFSLLCVSPLTAWKTACVPYQPSGYETEEWLCSGMIVKYVPWYLPQTLQTLLLTGTAISSLDKDTFRRHDLKELKTLHINGGKLTSVGPHAFCRLPALTMLHLDRNRLEMIDELSFSCNKFLRTLSLEHNPNLQQLPPLESSSMEHLYLDNCSLESINVTTVERIPALKVLSLTGNPDLHCPSVKSHFKHARPDLLVICDDPAPHLSSSDFPDDQETTSVTSYRGSNTAIENKKNDTIANSASGIQLSVKAIAAISTVIIFIFMTILIFFAWRCFHNSGYR